MAGAQGRQTQGTGTPGSPVLSPRGRTGAAVAACPVRVSWCPAPPGPLSVSHPTPMPLNRPTQREEEGQAAKSTGSDPQGPIPSNQGLLRLRTLWGVLAS